VSCTARARRRKIRKYLIDNNYVDTVIQLPPDLFFGTGIATCVLVLKKSKKDNAVLLIDASAESVRPGNKNKLSEPNQKRILDAYVARQDVAHFAQLVPNDRIAGNGYNLTVSSYVLAEDTSEAVDLSKLNAEIARVVARQGELREQIEAVLAEVEGSS
jgi:type I restriction enzyme M protein